jgi:hypothetical protein
MLPVLHVGCGEDLPVGHVAPLQIASVVMTRKQPKRIAVDKGGRVGRMDVAYYRIARAFKLIWFFRRHIFASHSLGANQWSKQSKRKRHYKHFSYHL